MIRTTVHIYIPPNNMPPGTDVHQTLSLRRKDRGQLRNDWQNTSGWDRGIELAQVRRFLKKTNNMQHRQFALVELLNMFAGCGINTQLHWSLP